MNKGKSGKTLSGGVRALACALAVSGGILVLPQIAGAANAIQLENQKPGTSAWQIGLYPYVNSNDTDQWIRGYASATSINKGEKITFNITVNPYSWKPGTPVPYYIDVYRVGWYGGLGGRLMKHLGPFNGVQQPGGTSSGGVSDGCPYDPDTGMIACQWTGDGLGNGSYTLDTSVNPDGSSTNDWTSGVYLALLTTHQMHYNPVDDPDHQSYIIFAIREDNRPSDVLFQQAVATYQAYNNYPVDGKTGKSLYDGGSQGPLTNLGTQRAVKVSFDRPYTYADHTGAGDFLHWELYFIRWLERNGYDVTYSTDVDTHASGAMLLNHKAFLSVGHGEYWSSEMRTAVENARDNGVGVGFFGANAVYSQIRFEPSPVTGAPNRVIVCYKDASLDPVNNPANTAIYNPSLTTVPFRNGPVYRPEQPLVGVMYQDFFDAEEQPQSWVVQNSGNWFYGGTGLTDGSVIPGILGYELDMQFPNAAMPSSVTGTYQLLSASPFTSPDGTGISNSSIYRAYNASTGTTGGWVFGAGTIDWSFGLDSYVPPAGINTRAFPAPSASVQQATANFLNLTTGRLPNPVNLKAAAGIGINLTWTSSSTAQTGFVVERSLDGMSFGQIGSVSGNVFTYGDTAVSAGTTYYYRVAAFNATGSSAYSNTASLAGPAPPTVTATFGTPQSTFVNTWFSLPLQATVRDGSGNPMSGVTVTFTAPASGPSGTFKGSTTATAVSNSSGIATPAVLTANSQAGSYVVTASINSGAATTSFSLTNNAPPTIAASAGTPQSATINTVFATPLQATVRDGAGNPIAGAAVTFSTPGSGPGASFGGFAMATATTNSSGIASAPALTANGQTGSFMVTAVVSGIPAPANFSLTNNPPGTAPSLSGVVNSSTTAVNLTAEGTSDWVHWGDASLNRKAGVTAQISNASATGAYYYYNNDLRAVSWTDGTPKTTSSGNFNGIYIPGLQSAFSFTAPADTTARTLMVHVGGWNSGATLTAHLSDGSAVDFVDVTSTATGQFDRNYTLTYAAISAGQTLTVTWKMTSGTGNVTLNGAALAKSFSISATAGTAQSAATNTVFGTALRATVLDGAGNPLSGVTVTFTAPTTGPSASFGGSASATAVTNSSGVATAPALTANSQAGSYTVTAKVTGAAAAATFSLTNSAQALTGSLSAVGDSNTTAVNLTTEGTTDWVHWGDQYLSRKAGVTPQIGNAVATGAYSYYNNDLRAISWTDGTWRPTSSGNLNGIYIAGVQSGFMFSAPADTATRTLIVHVAGWKSGATLVAHLSDGSAADFVDVTPTATGQFDRNYVLTYRAASAGQMLTVSWRMTSGTGNVSLDATALAQ